MLSILATMSEGAHCISVRFEEWHLLFHNHRSICKSPFRLYCCPDHSSSCTRRFIGPHFVIADHLRQFVENTSAIYEILPCFHVQLENILLPFQCLEVSPDLNFANGSFLLIPAVINLSRSIFGIRALQYETPLGITSGQENSDSTNFVAVVTDEETFQSGDSRNAVMIEECLEADEIKEKDEFLEKNCEKVVALTDGEIKEKNESLKKECQNVLALTIGVPPSRYRRLTNSLDTLNLPSIAESIESVSHLSNELLSPSGYQSTEKAEESTTTGTIPKIPGYSFYRKDSLHCSHAGERLKSEGINVPEKDPVLTLQQAEEFRKVFYKFGDRKYNIVEMYMPSHDALRKKFDERLPFNEYLKQCRPRLKKRRRAERVIEKGGKDFYNYDYDSDEDSSLQEILEKKYIDMYLMELEYTAALREKREPAVPTNDVGLCAVNKMPSIIIPSVNCASTTDKLRTLPRTRGECCFYYFHYGSCQHHPARSKDGASKTTEKIPFIFENSSWKVADKNVQKNATTTATPITKVVNVSDKDILDLHRPVCCDDYFRMKTCEHSEKEQREQSLQNRSRREHWDDLGGRLSRSRSSDPSDQSKFSQQHLSRNFSRSRSNFKNTEYYHSQIRSWHELWDDLGRRLSRSRSSDPGDRSKLSQHNLSQDSSRTGRSEGNQNTKYRAGLPKKVFWEHSDRKEPPHDSVIRNSDKKTFETWEPSNIAYAHVYRSDRQTPATDDDCKSLGRACIDNGTISICRNFLDKIIEVPKLKEELRLRLNILGSKTADRSVDATIRYETDKIFAALLDMIQSKKKGEMNQLLHDFFIRPVPCPELKDRCFNCFALDHEWKRCPKERILCSFCYNCGKRNRTMRICPRCSAWHFARKHLGLDKSEIFDPFVALAIVFKSCVMDL